MTKAEDLARGRTCDLEGCDHPAEYVWFGGWNGTQLIERPRCELHHPEPKPAKGYCPTCGKPN